MKKPFNVDDDKTNTLFNILFEQVQDKNFKVFDNKTDKEILSVLQNGNVGFNITANGLYFCVNINGELKKVSFSAITENKYLMPDYSTLQSRSSNVVYTADKHYCAIITQGNAERYSCLISYDEINWATISQILCTANTNVFFSIPCLIPKGVKYQFSGNAGFAMVCEMKEVTL